MSYELIITEKPAASEKIANALADGKAIKESIDKVPYYKVTHGKKDLVVACAVGHLYGLAEKKKGGYEYPVFDVKWVPTSEMNKSSAFSKKYLNVLKKLCKEADSYTIATDYDIEGEVIGLNVLRFTCNQKDASRMKFSTLTKPELVEAYEHKSKHLDWGQANAGLTRHELDWYWGINASRALTSAIKSTGGFKVMSSGRVQGPSLKIIVNKEKEIRAFKSVPFWQIELNGDCNEKIDAWHEKDKFWKKEEAEKVMDKVKGAKEGNVQDVKKTEFRQEAPAPFDLTSLQTEAYRVFKISPKDTLSIAQELYTSGYISYPRTSSNQLPKSVGYEKILSELKKQSEYTKRCSELLEKKNLNPNNGKKTDPAHPAMYPTGVIPKIDGRQKKVYDLIVKRFMATFAEAAVRETMSVNIDVKKEIFVSKGTRTVFKGWHYFYEPYVNLKEEELPKVMKGDIVHVKKIHLHEKETQPPKRFTPASIIKELEKKGLGTKATRAAIIDTLFQRGYVHGKSIEATELGINTVETLEKYCPKILDEKLTRHFEIEMEQIRTNEKKPEEVLEEAKESLKIILNKFKEKEKEIGKELAKANLEARKQASLIGKCPNCDEGDLSMRKGKFGMFVACNKYPECKTTFSLPSGAMIKSAGKECPECKHPMITTIRKGKKPQDLCLNMECPSKKMTKEEKQLGEDKGGNPCPKCKTGKLVLRKSVYGSFLGCSSYPKCRYTEKINGKKT